jgi:hypothetical protein
VPIFRLTFLSSNAAGYLDAVALARDGEAYTEEPAGRAIVHHVDLATFTPARIRHFLATWHAVQRWHGVRLELDGEHLTGSERFSAERLLECMAKAAEFTPPQRYCQSTPVRKVSSFVAGGSSPRPLLIPCRLWASQYGAFGDVDWGDPGRREDQLRASLVDRGVTRCPFLRLEPWGRSAMRPPTRVNNVVEFRPRGEVDSGA